MSIENLLMTNCPPESEMKNFPRLLGHLVVQYQIEIQITWDHKPGGDVRVLAAIDDGGWRAFMPLSADLILTPEREADE